MVRTLDSVAHLEEEGDTVEFRLADKDTQQTDEEAELGSTRGFFCRLVSIDKRFPNVEMAVRGEGAGGGSSTIGRDEAGGDRRVSKAHCEIWLDGETSAVWLRDLSANGTLVRGRKVGRGNQVELEQGDEVVLGPAHAGAPSYLVQVAVPHRTTVEASNRPGFPTHEASRVPGGGRGDGLDQEPSTNEGEPQQKRQKRDESEAFRCSVCHDIFYDCVSLAPCQHNFCNFCFSVWYQKQKAAGRTCLCATCRAPVASVGRNHTIRSLVEELLEERPELRRSEAERAELEAGSLVKTDSVAIAAMPPVAGAPAAPSSSGEGSPLADTDEEESEVEAANYCRQCRWAWPPGSEPNEAPRGTGGGFRCGREQVHLRCTACFGLVPSRAGVGSRAPITCGLCNDVVCDAYWREQGIPCEDGTTEGCPAWGSLQTVNEREWLAIPPTAFRGERGNRYEQQVLADYLREKDLTLAQVVQGTMRRHDAGDFVLRREYNPRSRPETTAMDVDANTPLCNKCAPVVVGELLFHFRLQLPKSELSVEAARREDCWYGINCRTQHHNPQHAKRLNHACLPIR